MESSLLTEKVVLLTQRIIDVIYSVKNINNLKNAINKLCISDYLFTQLYHISN